MTIKEKPKVQKKIVVTEHFLNEYKVHWVALGSNKIEQIFSFSLRAVNYTLDKTYS